MRSAAFALAVLAGAAPGWAQTDFTNLTKAERAIFHAEIRAVLLSSPDLVAPAPAAPAYADEIAGDLARIAAHAQTLFGSGDDAADLAFVTGSDCAECDRAEAELRSLAKRYGATFTRLPRDAHSDLMRDLGLDMVPAYIFPDKVFRGAMPAIVLERYLGE